MAQIKKAANSIMNDIGKAWQSKGVRYTVYGVGTFLAARYAYKAYGKHASKKFVKDTQQEKDVDDVVRQSMSGIYDKAILAGIKEFQERVYND